MIQRISSIFLLISFLRLNIYPNTKPLFYMIFLIAIRIKIGFFPFHFWVPSTIEGLNWFNCFILTTIQKIVPLIILFIITTQKIIIIFCLVNSLIASIRGINQFSIRKIIRFSSINHLSLLIIRIFLSKKLFKIYFLTYSIITLFTFRIIAKLNLRYIFQTLRIIKSNKILYLTLIIALLRMAGTPPLLGFFPKMIVILIIIEVKMFLPSLILLITNVLATYFYTRITIRRLFLNLRVPKFQKKTFGNFTFILTSFFIFSPLLFFIWALKLKKLSIFKIEFKYFI